LSYRHIGNLYQNQTILQFKRCFWTEKVHGTSASLSWNSGTLKYSPGGCKYDTFVAIFNHEALVAAFTELGHDEVVVYGEQYGGKQQGMSKTYGPDPKFIVFEVQVGEFWLDVPKAANVAEKLGLEFVPWGEIPAEMADIDAARDADSEVAVRRGMGPGHKREGVVLRPITEWIHQSGHGPIRVKHKREDFQETRTKRVVGDPLAVQAGEAAALEWVTDERMRHVCDHVAAVLGRPPVMENVRDVIAAMIEDVLREGAEEVTDDRPTRKAIGTAAVKAFKARLMAHGDDA